MWPRGPEMEKVMRDFKAWCGLPNIHDPSVWIQICWQFYLIFSKTHRSLRLIRFFLQLHSVIQSKKKFKSIWSSVRVLTLKYPHQKTPSQSGQRESSLSSSGSTFSVFPFAFSPFVFTTFRNANLMTLVNSKISVDMPIWDRFNLRSIILNYSNCVCSNSSWVLACSLPFPCLQYESGRQTLLAF